MELSVAAGIVSGGTMGGGVEAVEVEGTWRRIVRGKRYGLWGLQILAAEEHYSTTNHVNISLRLRNNSAQ